MRNTRDAPARPLKKPRADRPFPRGATTRKTPTLSSRLPDSRLPDLELVMPLRRGMRSLMRPSITHLGLAQSSCPASNLPHDAPKMTMHATPPASTLEGL